ncbi:killer toxin subunits alpha beta [Fusarium albosuccineum]|uniref:chitinase n=1 Tax=Fusarium albosuccineum TaxID=1237068 RepID=A0A8H4L4A3_9HYPO|nr:killer toxin subunits alpha beta [Fusarium albosuccineum]
MWSLQTSITCIKVSAEPAGPGDWSLYPTADRLAVCPEPLLLGFGLNTEFNDEKADNPIYACTLGNATTKTNFLTEQDFVDPDAMGKTNFDPVRRRAVGANTTCGAGPSEKLDTLIRLSAWESVAEPIGNDSGADVVVVTKKLEEYLERNQSACGKTIMFAYFRGTLVGLYSGSQVDRRKTLESLTSALNYAVNGGPNTRHAIEACDGRPASDVFGLVADPTGDFAAVQAAVKSWNEGKCVAGTEDGKTKDIHKVSAWGYTLAPKTEGSSPRSLRRRDTCRTIEIEHGDTCETLSKRCGISTGLFESLNRDRKALCNAMPVGQPVCCSSGAVPIMKAKVLADGFCTSYETKMGDICDTIAARHGISVDDLGKWGRCGLTDEVCLKSKSTTGNPGTGQQGEGGCISNCERTLTNNNEAPQKFRKIGYFEAWNYDRLCLHMHVLDIDKSYSHIHFSFAEISQNLNVVIPENGTGTGLFRKAVSPDDRQAFANRVVEFAVENNLDGVDFDWEYPGATDIEGSEPGQRDDGENYFQFLKLVPSFWYLKSFPIKKMAPLLDYVIFMTYDLHGQWDVGSRWASPGCPAGNCLRSHANSTETMDTLIMVTRAGVESHKVAVGVSSYGRSFKMSSSTCRGPQCTYLGGRSDSKAKKGRCTDTAGYISDFEINEIIAKGGAIKKWYDEATDSDYLVYERDEWVAYMSKVTKSRRMRDYMKLNFGGTTDWAIDLQDDHDKRYTSGRPVFLNPKVWETPSATCEAPCVLVFPPSKLPEATTIKLDKYTTSLEYGATGKTTISGKETTAFVTKTTTITVDVPIFVTNSMMYSNVNITQDQKPTELVVKPSIKLPHIPVQVPDGGGGTTTRNLTLPPWPFSTQTTGGSSNHSRPSRTSSFNWDDLETPPPPWIDAEETPDETLSGLPVYTQWPPEFKIEPIKEEIKEPTPDDDGFKTSCELWFFQLCFPGFKGLKWRISPGIIPPGVATMAVGGTLGLSPKSTLVMANMPWEKRRSSPMLLSAWAATLQDIVERKRLGNAVINASVLLGGKTPDAYLRMLYQLLIETGKTQTVVVTAAGNAPDENAANQLIDEYPPSFGGKANSVGLNSIADLIVVGSTNEQGWKGDSSKSASDIDIIYAPGHNVLIPDGSGKATTKKRASPLVAGLVAHLRSLPSKSYQDQLREPATVKRLIKGLSRSIATWDEDVEVIDEPDDLLSMQVIWNGHSGDESCLMGKVPPPDGCRVLPPDLSTGDLSPGGSTKRIKWEPGPDGPKCSAKSLVRRLFERAEATCGGQLCSGYYCRPNPLGPPPDFRDPKDPNRNGNDPQGGVKPPTTVTTTTSKPEPTGGSGSPDDNFGLRFMDKDCGESMAADEYGKTERGCTSASSSSDYSMLSGGSGIPSSGGCVGFSTKAIKAYRVTSGDCSGDIEDAWSLSFSKDCSGSLGEMSGYGKIECSNNIPKGANSVTGKIPKKGNWKACLYIYENCKTTEDPPGNEVFAHWNGDGCESFKSKKEFRSFILTNGTMCPFGE